MNIKLFGIIAVILTLSCDYSFPGNCLGTEKEDVKNVKNVKKDKEDKEDVKNVKDEKDEKNEEDEKDIKDVKNEKKKSFIDLLGRNVKEEELIKLKSKKK